PTPTPRKHNRTNRAFSPRFDVYETDDAYHLYGDLPGVSDKKSVGIEFSDPRTLLVTGRVERWFPKPTTTTTTTTTTIEEQQQQQQQPEEKRRSLNPTVEDTDDEDDFSVVTAATSSVEKQQHKEEEEQQQQQQQQEEEEKRKVWLAERTFGTFQRTFSFPTPVALEDVSAKLENGLLQIVVPKVRFEGVRRIEVE
ncbi:HSP20-like chaperone, partial [Wilcoxina mikolae CBS 423.85]